MISIDRLEEMAIEELQTELKNFKEQIKLQNNFINSLLKATNNSEWLDKSMLDDEVSEVIEKIELDYAQLDQLKAENEELTTINARLLGRLEVDEKDTSLVFNLDKELRQKEKEFYTAIQKVVKLKQTLTEIKEIIEQGVKIHDDIIISKQILQKISEVEDD